MLTESFVAATEAVHKPSAHLSSTLKDVGIFQYEFQPQNTFRHGFKKSSVKANCLAVSQSHIYAAQLNKAVIHVYNREKGNQEATIAFPDKIHSLAYARKAAILIIGTDDGKLILWEIATGRTSTSAASHLEAVSSLVVTKNNELIISGSADSSVHVWSLARLVIFPSTSQTYNDTEPQNTPLRTFSHHRTGVTALAIGHSQTSTNFAVSAAADRTCYLWHTETCHVLRTFLTPCSTLSITIDPADRAIYLGNEDGTVQSVDLFGEASNRSKRAIYDTSDAAPIQVTSEDNWTASSSDIGATTCLALSYDGTALLSGHTGGTVIRWDVVKHRIISEVANLHQPVNSIQMLVPDGLRHESLSYVIPAIVKPRLELNAESTDNTVGIPASYSFTAQVVRSPSLPGTSEAVSAVLAGSLFPDCMLDDAIQAMHAKSAGVSGSTSASNVAGNKHDIYKIQALEEDNVLLEKKLAVMQKLYNDAQERHRKRSEQRDKVGQQRREAYFAAKKKGKDGDEAMKPFEKKLEAIDVESDEEELKGRDEMEVDN